ncbi:hypothetical protein K439DRAFT_1617081 [Ramaria rubella]|nr:hypothetical protein K439DRAFT_1617081 [Ramaria rubella]
MQVQCTNVKCEAVPAVLVGPAHRTEVIADIAELHSGELRNIWPEGLPPVTPALEDGNGSEHHANTGDDSPADIDMANHTAVSAPLRFHNCCERSPAEWLAPAPSTSVTTIDNLAAFQEASHDSDVLVAFF